MGLQSNYGALAMVHRVGPQVKDNMTHAPYAVDLLCRNTSGGNLVGAIAGSDWVEIDWANYVAGQRWPVKKLVASGSTLNNPALGVVHWNAGTVADDDVCLVRIYGEHPYAKVEGTTDVLVGSSLSAHTTAGQVAIDGASPEDNVIAAHALVGQALNSVQPARVFILNSSQIWGA